MESRERMKKPIAGRWTRTSTIVLNSGESGAMTDEVVVMTMEEQAPVGIEKKDTNMQ